MNHHHDSYFSTTMQSLFEQSWKILFDSIWWAINTSSSTGIYRAFLLSLTKAWALSHRKPASKVKPHNSPSAQASGKRYSLYKLIITHLETSDILLTFNIHIGTSRTEVSKTALVIIITYVWITSILIKTQKNNSYCFYLLLLSRVWRVCILTYIT